jgi:hypothetical protein
MKGKVGVPWGWSELTLWGVAWFFGAAALGWLAGTLKRKLWGHDPPTLLGFNKMVGILSALSLHANTLWWLVVFVSFWHGLSFWSAFGLGPTTWPSCLLFWLGGATTGLLFMPWDAYRPPAQSYSRLEFALILVAIFFDPVVQELALGGYFYPVFARTLGTAVASVVLALAHPAIHLPQMRREWPQLAVMLLLGAFCAAARVLTGATTAGCLLSVGFGCAQFVLTLRRRAPQVADNHVLDLAFQNIAARWLSPPKVKYSSFK